MDSRSHNYNTRQRELLNRRCPMTKSVVAPGVVISITDKGSSELNNMHYESSQETSKRSSDHRLKGDKSGRATSTSAARRDNRHLHQIQPTGLHVLDVHVFSRNMWYNFDEVRIVRQMKVDALEAIIAIQHQIEDFLFRKEFEVSEETENFEDQQAGCRPCAGEVAKSAVERRVWRYGRLEDRDLEESSEDEEGLERKTDERSRLRQRWTCKSPRERVWWVDQV
ncbi:hypothetical protein EG327_005024 [Venturia inaequalis]|uniref:Uncharacterized protein n=1 Tax=Venturia inaequalis TaxID=5025 RepID=A0A8H3V773_VENIN|nr:hypothetical protein EG327_005024 [Venturia inaequalis]